MTKIKNNLTSEKNNLISLNVQALSDFLGVKSLIIDDILKGEIEFNIRKSGYSFIPLYSLNDKRFLFHLPAVVDEKIMNSNILIRGEDKISIAPIHDLLRIFMGMSGVKYLHLPLLMDPNTGKRLKGNSFYINEMILKFPLQILMAYILNSGYLSKGKIYWNIDEFINEFEYKKIKKKSGNFYPIDLQSISDKFLKRG